MPVQSPAVSAPEEAVVPLMRGVAVLRRLTEAGGTMRPSELERATGLARSTVDRVVATLARMGYVRLDGGRAATLTPRVMELGNACLAAMRLPDLLGPRADALADELDESVSLAVADLDGIRFIHQATRRRAMSLSFRIGDLLPAERTAPGPLFAGEWTDADWARWRGRRAADPYDRAFTAVPPAGRTGDDEAFVRRSERAVDDGWATDDQLIEPGLVAVSVPVRRPAPGRRIACVANVVSHTSRHSADGLAAALLPRLRAAVAGMEEELRQAPPPEAGPTRAGLALWTGASKQELGRGFVESLARGLTVLTAFGAGRSEPTLAEVAKATGLARATARRALITYEHLGLVAPGALPRTFVLTPQVLSLGFPPLSRTTLPRIAGPHLAELAGLVHESTSLAVLTEDGEEVLVTAGTSVHGVTSVEVRVGSRLPARGTAAGRVLLGGERFVLADEEAEQGVRSVAVPVRDRAGRVVAAAAVATHTARRSAEECVRDLRPALLGSASAIEADLGVAARYARVPLL